MTQHPDSFLVGGPIRADFVISGPSEPGPIRVPRQRTLRGKPGYVGDVELYEPGAPSVKIVDPIKDAHKRIDPAILAALDDELISEVDLWLDTGGDPEGLTEYVRNALHDLIDGSRNDEATPEPDAKERPGPERNKERKPRRTKAEPAPVLDEWGQERAAQA